ncbi:unnamed protein product [Ilex paraguariensis]|uniref:Condensin complex subunit 1 C-terminal domain-containing protein n=1 Tax=Ilex paraguariensis TaxID=185542 RepID=A0ABC8RRE8_9AQUA
MEEVVYRIVSEFEIHHSLLENPNSSTPISESVLLDLQTLLDYTSNTKDPIDIDCLFDELSSKNLSVSILVRTISSAMDSGPTHIGLLASKVYLSLLLCPNAPVFTLFTPMAFLSLLRSIRRSFKKPNSGTVGHLSSQHRARRKKGGGRGGQLRNRSQNVQDGENESEERVFDVRVLFSVLERLELVLCLIHLDRFPDSLKSLVQAVAEIPVMAIELCGNSGNYGKLCHLCSRVLSEVLKAEHGDQSITAAEVLKSLSPSILFLKSQARDFALGFIVNKMMVMTKDSSEIKKAIVNLPKYLVQKAPERSEPRASAVESIMEIVKVMEFGDQVGFAEYVVKMSQGKAQLRLLAVDLVPMLIMSLRDPLGVNTESGVENSWGLRCLEALIRRCSDVIAGIRARALTTLAQCVGFLSDDDRSQTVLKEVMGFGNEGTNSVEGGITDILRQRCMDEKAAVRKAALLLVSKLMALLGGALDGVLLAAMGMACSDPLVSIRKAAVSALSEAFRTFSYDNVTKEWLHSVPRLISDNESSIQEECETMFLELVLDRVSRAGSTYVPHEESVFSDPNGKLKDLESKIDLLYPEGVLGLLKEICDGEVTPWVKKICTSLGKKKRLKAKIATALQNIIRTSEFLWLSHSMPIEKWTAPPGAWFLLSEVSAFLSKAVDWEFLHHHWQLLDKYGPEGELKSPLQNGDLDEEVMGIESHSVAWAGDRVFLLQTISNVSVELPPEPAADLAHNLLKRIEEFDMHATEVNAHVRALRTLCKRKALNPEEANSLVMKWVGQLLSKATGILEMYMSKDTEAYKDSSVLTPLSGTRKAKKAAIKLPTLVSQAITAVYTIGSLVIVSPSADLKTIIPVLHTIITSGSSDLEFSNLLGPAVSVKQRVPSLYIQAWLTMGKICLADGKLAKRYIPLFVQELEKSDCAALRNNIVVMMADFCVRYTALIDCYISKITKCLRDPCELVRRQTFILLSRLLQRDYVKWRGVLFLRFLLSLVDESEKIRQLADFFFGNILKAKAPLLAYNSFVEAIFVLNDCNAHTGHSNTQSLRTENQLFSLRGNDEMSRSKRMHIYVSLLKQMAPEHLLATFAKVCAEILASASDGALSIEDTTGKSVLQDAFQILSCKEIRIPSNRGSSSESAGMDEESGESGEASAARGRIITQAVKKGLIQNTIPIFIELKRLLESKNSPLTGSLMECLRVLLKDYKNEIDDILVADKQLQKELIYDMQKYDSMKMKSTAAEAVATMQRSDTYRSPGEPKAVSGRNSQNKFTEKLHGSSKVASAMADAVAEATARSVLREVNLGASTPPLCAMSVPKLKPTTGRTLSQGDQAAAVLESLRRRQSFESDEE